jgi:hypothetical protein
MGTAGHLSPDPCTGETAPGRAPPGTRYDPSPIRDTDAGTAGGSGPATRHDLVDHYNIFTATRIRGEAMKEGLRDGTVKDLAEISIGVALGVLIDTFLVRVALVPGLTLWVGPNAGWPWRRWTKG